MGVKTIGDLASCKVRIKWHNNGGCSFSRIFLFYRRDIFLFLLFNHIS
jgi:hypothetical protein